MISLVTKTLLLITLISIRAYGLAIRDAPEGQSPANLPPKRLTFRVCGNFCGPDWCAGEVISEENCVKQNVWQTVPAASGQVVDSCCRTHDDCCGKGISRPTCNTAIVACIQANKAYWSFCGAAVWAAMKIVGAWCCGTKCPIYTDPLVPLTLAGKSYTDGLVRISFTDASFAVEAIANYTSTGALRTVAESVSCSKQSYALGHDSLLVDLGSMMASSANVCGKLLMAATPAHEAHPLLDAPDTVMYWPHADVIAVNKHSGGVLQLEREH
eukprot:GILI01007587.1.p1 GENE.GILI01007587.1~~GILI01007587.1.p1  ORF type:complete len:283 (+),score=8.64 GILI01007587.1:41-850(+)